MSAHARSNFLQQYQEEVRGEDVAGLGPAALEALADSFWDWAATQPAEARVVRMRDLPAPNGGGPIRTVLEATGPDAPFLVDSLLNECVASGHEVRALIHPIAKRDDGADGAQSLIQIHLSPLNENEKAALKAGAELTLSDVSAAIGDYSAMRARMQEEARKIASLGHLDSEERAEAVAFLEWLVHEHFLFLGSRAYAFETDANGSFLPREPEMIDGSNLGILRDEARNVLNRGAEPTVITREIGDFLQAPAPIIIAKSTMMSRVHRRARADYIGVKQYDAEGRVQGEVRFAGLFTAEAYNETVHSIPLVRRRVEKVLAASGRLQSRHSQKALDNILETWPRDELLQTDAETLTPMAIGALHLIGQPRTRLFLRYDRFDRYVSAIVYVVREAYTSDLRERIARRLEEALDGRVSSFQPRFDGGPLARVHFVIELSQGHPTPDVATLEAELAALARRWDDAYRDALAASPMEGPARAGAACFQGAFNDAYREAFSPEEGVKDVAELAQLSAAEPIRMSAFRQEGEPADRMQAKIYSRDGAIPLSRCVPVLENMGLFVEFETGFPVRPTAAPAPGAPDLYWVHHTSIRSRDGREIDLEAVEKPFEAAFAAVWMGRTEDDGFNRLILAAGVSWREAALLRALAAFRYQTGLDPATQIQIDALVAYPEIAKRLVAYFAARFDPASGDDLDVRREKARAIHAEILDALQDVPSLDHDRVLRRLADLIGAVQRTSFYQRDANGAPRSTLAVKIASAELDDLPAPKPYREIFVSSPKVDGVHLRFGPVARGGLRWSDRRGDYRTEVLGLVKAQQVKNAVIVPTGSKGGFVPKQIPVNAGRDEVREAGVAAYREFIGALLSVTDNLVDGAVAHPEDTVVWDGEDPYLVVAADKGTATFSDIANEISEAHGFWLGDAFASGGSAGYDHKKMGITARGAWEAVKRHFREDDKDIQSEPFTVIGVGDMSGDVFGNGMLLSKETRLVAAFNHLHVFVDPSPADPERLWQERKRLYDLPRSSWADYDASLISKGGGVFDRAAKSVALTPEIKALTGLDRDAVTPSELIHALLKAPAELLWFGGIGTYVKASHEGHVDVGDRTNDPIRVNAKELGVRVIGEGANLGLSQAARIEAAQAGVRLNTDAIDNSAGVDSSDHEVNIKILLSDAIRRGDLERDARNELLASMTDEVADKVLAHNYAQTGALTLAEAAADQDHDAYERLMVWLEGRGVLDRSVEGLPSTQEMTARGEAGDWLTRPELSVLLAWSKITLFQDLVASDLPDDPCYGATLRDYFPSGLERFEAARGAHRLKREIVATIVSNRLVDAGGPAFLTRLREAGRCDNPTAARAYETARRLFRYDDVLAQVRALDNSAPAALQTRLLRSMAEAVFLTSAWLAVHCEHRPINDLTEEHQAAADLVSKLDPGVLSAFGAARFETRMSDFIDAGAPRDLAAFGARLPLVSNAPAISVLATKSGAPLEDALRAFFLVRGALCTDRMRAYANDQAHIAPFWDRLATRRALNDVLEIEIDAARAALRHDGGPRGWLDQHARDVDAVRARIDELDLERAWSFAKFALATDAVRGFMTGNR